MLPKAIIVLNYFTRNKLTMKKKLQLSILAFSAIIFFGCSGDNSGLYEEDAIASLDKLSEVIGELESCSFTVNTIDSKENDETVRKTNDMYMRGSGNMYYYTESAGKRIGHWFNGEKLAVFNYDSNQYDVMDAPATIIETIDLFHKDFRINFPAADFFYPSLTDDLMENFDTITTVGTRTVEDVECIEINATNNKLDVYILIEQSTNLPKALAVYNLGEQKGAKYISVFSNWRKDPQLPDNIFKFTPPANSIKAELLTSKLAK